MSTTIFQRLEKKLDRLKEDAVKKAEKNIRHERIMEMAREMDFFEKIKLIIKIL